MKAETAWYEFGKSQAKKHLREMARLNFRPATTPGTADINVIHGALASAVAGSSDVCVAGCDNGAIYRSTALPGIWAAPTSPVAAAIYDIGRGNGVYIGVCAASAAQRVIRCAAGPASTWSAIVTTRIPALKTVATDGASTWLAGGDFDTLKQIWRSTDNGSTWAAIVTPAGMDGTAGGVNSIRYVSGTTYLCVVTNGGIWKTTDSGTNWTQVKAHVAGDLLYQLLVGENRIFCAGEDNGGLPLFYASEGLTGTTWAVVTPTMPYTTDIFTHKGAAYGKQWIFPSDANHISYTADDGLTWSVFGTGGYFGAGNAPLADFKACAIARTSYGAPVFIAGSTGGIIVQSEIPPL